MAEIYIRTDPSTKVVTFTHRRPFDPIHGLGATREELLKTGFFVEEFPSPNSTPGQRAIPYYDHETKKIHFEYQALPFAEKTRLDMLEQIVNGLVLQFPEVCNILEATTPMTMSLDDEDPEVVEQATIEELNRGERIMSGFPQYLAYQIHIGNLNKEEIFRLYPDMEEEIELLLEEWDIIPTIPNEDPEDLNE